MMSDCSNAAVRDLLPDLLHDQLDVDDRRLVESHVAGCAACEAELRLLRGVLVAYAVPALNVAKIAGAVAPYHRSRGFLASRPLVRLAAAVVLMALGGASYSIVARSIIGDHEGPGEGLVASNDSLLPGEAIDEDALDDAELASILNAIENLDATFSDEPRPVVRSLNISGN